MASIAAHGESRRAFFGLVLPADWAVIAGLGVLVVLMRGVEFGNPVAEMDDQLYSFIGWRMLSGELPFVDWWDRKPFGLFAIFALAHAIGGPGPLAYQVPAALATLGGALMTYRLALSLAGRSGAAIAGAFYIVLMSSYAGTTGQSEAFHVPLMLAMAMLVRDPARPHATRRALCAMAIGGLALQVKYTVLPQCVFFGLWALAGQWRRGVTYSRLARMAAAFGALGLAPTLLVGLFYWAIGEWDAFYFANFVSFFLREGAFATRYYPRLWIWLLPLGVALLAGLHSSRRIGPPRDPLAYRFYGLWLVAALATVFLPRTIYPFYLAALVPCAALITTPLFERRTLLGLAPALLGLGYMIHLNALGETYLRSRVERVDIARFAAAIAPHVGRHHNCLFVFDGPTVLYRLTGACAPSRIVYPDHLNSALETPAIGMSQDGEVARILAGEPGVVVTADTPVVRQNFSSHSLVRVALKRDYEPIATMELKERRIIAWGRRDQ